MWITNPPQSWLFGRVFVGLVIGLTVLLAIVLATPENDEDDGIDEDVFGDNEKED